MEYSVDAAGHRAFQSVAIAQISHDEVSAGRDRRAMATLEVVEDDDLVTRRQQVSRDDRADVTGAAGDQNSHRGAGRSDVVQRMSHRLRRMSHRHITDLESVGP